MHTDKLRFVVGDNGREKEFLIPRSVFEQYSWFPSDLMRNSLESIRLDKESPIAFTYFHYYLYHQDVTFGEAPVFDEGRPETQKKREQFVTELCDTWIFGDKYGIPGLQNCAMFKLIEVLCTSQLAEEEILLPLE